MQTAKASLAGTPLSIKNVRGSGRALVRKTVTAALEPSSTFAIAQQAAAFAAVAGAEAAYTGSNGREGTPGLPQLTPTLIGCGGGDGVGRPDRPDAPRRMYCGPWIVRIHALHVRAAVQGYTAAARGLARGKIHARRHVLDHVLHIHGIFPRGEAELLLGGFSQRLSEAPPMRPSFERCF